MSARPRKTCTECGRDHYALGLCSLHYGRLRRGHPFDAPLRRVRAIPPCTECGGDHYAKGLCAFHYGRQRKGIPLNAPKRVRRSGYGIFDSAACGTPAQYKKHLRYKIPMCESCRQAENRRTQDQRKKTSQRLREIGHLADKLEVKPVRKKPIAA